jgi:hypothetical protein
MSAVAQEITEIDTALAQVRDEMQRHLQELGL